MPIYLYVKTHRVTGLKYLGKTVQDPYTYRGSGKYWNNHINKHGYEVDTKILCECKTQEEVKERGLYYSKLWNVVESKEWANLKEETGDGFSSEQSKRMHSNAKYRKRNIKHLQDLHNDPYIQEKRIKNLKETMSTIEYRKKQSELNTGKNNSQYDHTVYHFKHDSGLEEKCTQYELRKKYSLPAYGINRLVKKENIYKSYKGWRLIKE